MGMKIVVLYVEYDSITIEELSTKNDSCGLMVIAPNVDTSSNYDTRARISDSQFNNDSAPIVTLDTSSYSGSSRNNAFSNVNDQTSSFKLESEASELDVVFSDGNTFADVNVNALFTLSESIEISPFVYHKESSGINHTYQLMAHIFHKLMLLLFSFSYFRGSMASLCLVLVLFFKCMLLLCFSYF